MEQTESDLIGKPLEAVPRREPDEDCNARRWRKRDGDSVFVGYCSRTAGWGTDSDNGRCRTHGQNGGAPEGNDNAAGNGGGDGGPEGNRNPSTHDLYTDQNKFYQEVATDALRALCDRIYKGYIEKFREVNGDSHPGDEARLSQIAINHIKIIHGDNWATDRPDTLDSGNALVDRETRIKTTEHEARKEHRYSEAAVAKAQRYLRKEDRKWLKEMGLLGADAIDVSVEGQVDHEHSHGLDDDTRAMIDELGEDLKV